MWLTAQCSPLPAPLLPFQPHFFLSCSSAEALGRFLLFLWDGNVGFFTSCCAGRNPTAHLSPYGVSLRPEQRRSIGLLGVSRSDLTHSSAIPPLPTFSIPRQNVCPQHPNPTEPHYPQTACGAPCDSPVLPRLMPQTDGSLQGVGEDREGPVRIPRTPRPPSRRPQPQPRPFPGDAAAAARRAPPPSRVPPRSRRPLSAHGGGDRGFARKCGSVAPPRVETLPLPPAAKLRTAPVSAGGVAERGGAPSQRKGRNGGGAQRRFPQPRSVRASSTPRRASPSPAPHIAGDGQRNARPSGAPGCGSAPHCLSPCVGARCGAALRRWDGVIPHRHGAAGARGALPDAGLGGAA